MKAILFALLTSLLISVNCNAQTVQGSIVDRQGIAIPFSTVFVKELTQGAISNQEGKFRLDLPAGNYTIIFQSLGYQQVSKEVRLADVNVELMVVLPDMVYELTGVTISGKEDPAYNIMRNVIGRAPYYARFVKKFEANVYIKGSLHINNISSLIKWMAKDDLKEFDIKEGDTYLEESVNEVVFTAPDQMHQKVVSIKSTFPKFSDDQSDNAMGFIVGNIYGINGFGAAISPIRTGAFRHYNYRYEGRKNYNDYSVHKITILPKGKGTQYVGGTIYIVDGLWCISSIDIQKEEQMGVKLHLTQNYNEVREDAWLPVTNRLRIDVDLLGNSGSFDYHSTVKYKSIDLLSNEKERAVVAEKKLTDNRRDYHNRKKEQIEKANKQISDLLKEEKLSTSEAYKLSKLQQKKEELRIKDSLRFNHEYTEKYKIEIDSNATRKDSIFWNNIRPVPLTGNEIKSIHEYDSLKIANTKNDSDSVVQPRKGAWVSPLLFSGILYKDSLISFQTKGLINPFSLNFNVVDGFKYQTEFYLNQKISSFRNLSFESMLGYAFSRKKFYGEVTSALISKRKNEKIGIRIGNQAVDFNSDGIAPLESTLEGLIFKENPARFYLSEYADVLAEREIFHGVKGTLRIYFSNNTILDNSTSYSFFFKDSKNYKPNIPDNPDYRMAHHQDFSTEISLSYKPMPFYYIKDGVKIPYSGLNDYPQFTFTWRSGHPQSYFDTDYDLIKLSVNQEMKLGLSNHLNYMFEGGYFIDTTSMWFPQFQHFAKRPLIAGVKEFFPYFLLLDTYKFSTNEYYFVSHLQYKSPFIALKRIPGIRNRLWDESLFFSYLYSPTNKNYIEAGYGIGNLLLNLGVFAGFRGTEYQQIGVRLAILIFGTKEISF